jgi:hypothetical protein
VGISQNELCKKFNLDSKSLSRTAKRRSLTPQQFLEQSTGWIYRSKKWYPPAQK